jgi:hypothetical protein
LQQILNYVLFKTDQIIFHWIISASVFNYNDLDLKKFIFLSKFPEIVSGVMVSLAVLYTPYFYKFEGKVFVFNFKIKILFH